MIHPYIFPKKFLKKKIYFLKKKTVKNIIFKVTQVILSDFSSDFLSNNSSDFKWFLCNS